VEKPKALWLSALAQSIAEARAADFRVSSVAHLLHFGGGSVGCRRPRTTPTIIVTL